MIKWHNISVSEAEEMLYDSHMLVLDMRDFRSYLADHHPRALHLTSDNLRAILKHTARSVPVLIYCYHGHRSQDMAQLFSDFGFTSCYSLDGGYEAWCPDIRHPDNELSKELRQWIELFPNATIHRYDQVGHFVAEEAPTQMAQDLRLFLLDTARPLD